MEGQPIRWLPKHGRPNSVVEDAVQNLVRIVAHPVVYLALLSILTLAVYMVLPT